jgi:hypothetical protein
MMCGSDKNYQAHDDKHTLKRAAEITGDKKRHAAAKAAAHQDIKVLQGITGSTGRSVTRGATVGKTQGKSTSAQVKTNTTSGRRK